MIKFVFSIGLLTIVLLQHLGAIELEVSEVEISQTCSCHGSRSKACHRVEMAKGVFIRSSTDYLRPENIKLKDKVDFAGGKIESLKGKGYFLRKNKSVSYNLVDAFKQALSLKIQDCAYFLVDHCNRDAGYEKCSAITIDKAEDGEVTYTYLTNATSEVESNFAQHFQDEKGKILFESVGEKIRRLKHASQQLVKLDLSTACTMKVGRSETLNAIVLYYCQDVLGESGAEHITKCYQIEFSKDLFNNIWDFIDMSGQN